MPDKRRLARELRQDRSAEARGIEGRKACGLGLSDDRTSYVSRDADADRVRS
jgi:hypothetical protein